MTTRMANMAVAALLVFGLVGCASNFKSDVSSWHQLPPPNGESFAIIAKHPAKRTGIEVAHDAGQVSQRLQSIGYRPVRSDAQALHVVRVDYGVSSGRTEIRSYGSYMGMGYGRGPYGYGYGPHPYYYYGGFDSGNVRSYAVYSRYLEMEIASANNALTNLYESKVVSDGKNNRLEEVMPYLVESMFTDFPGPSGVTREVVLEPTENAGSQ